MIFNDKYILKEIHSNSNCIPVIFHGQAMKNIDIARWVDDLDAALMGQKVIIKPNSPSEGVIVAFIEVNGAPVELLQYSSPAEGG